VHLWGVRRPLQSNNSGAPSACNEEIRHGVTARIKNFDPAKLENMTCLEIASYFNTTKSRVYNIMSDLGIKYKHIKKRSGNHKKNID